MRDNRIDNFIIPKIILIVYERQYNKQIYNSKNKFDSSVRNNKIGNCIISKINLTVL